MRFLLFVNGDKPLALESARRLIARWDAQGADWGAMGEDAAALGAQPVEAPGATDDLVGVVVGGDGTLLRAARTVPDAPLMVVNFGTVGFLAAIEPEDVERALDDLGAGKLALEERLKLTVSVDGGPEHVAVNEVVLGRRKSRRTLDVSAEVDGEELWRWPADGVLVATPTGSTAYALSAGGPLVVPGSDVLTIVPICAHALMSRAIVLPGDSRVSLRPVVSSEKDVAVTADGVTLAVGPVGVVSVARAAEPLRLLVPSRGRFERIRHKLDVWGSQGGAG